MLGSASQAVRMKTSSLTRKVQAAAIASRLPVRVKALAVAARAPAVPGVNGVPVEIAVGGVAVGAESGVVMEPGLVNLGETERGPQILSPR